MALINSDVIPVGATGGGGAYYDYTIGQSLFTQPSNSSYAYRTPSTAGNQKTNTFSFWYKPQNLGVNRYFFTSNQDRNSDNWFIYGLTDENKLYVDNWDYQARTNYQLNDPSAWYHIVFITDTTQSTSSDRWRFYINGERQEAQSGATYPTLNQDTGANNTNQHELFTRMWQSYNYLGGTVAEMHFIDGQALEPSNFGETGTYGDWKPIEYTGSYGTNGFYMDFSNTSNICKDYSGNGNDYTTTGISAYDVKLDSPTNNFATLNPNANPQGATLSEGNLRAAGVTTDKKVFATQSIKGGKWYWEIYLKTQGNRNMLGVVSDDVTWNNTNVSDGTVEKVYCQQGNTRQRDETQEYFNSVTGTWATGDIITIAFDADNGKIWIHKNQAPATGTTPSTTAGTGTTGMTTSLTYLPYYMEGGGTVSNDIFNFGQDSSFAGNKTAQGNQDDNSIGDFYYSPPSGFLALCTANLSDPDIIPGEHFNTIIWDGADQTADRSFTGVGFQPDFVWTKERNNTSNHLLVDAVRGAGEELHSNSTDAEQTNNSYGYLSSFDSDGFSTVNGGTYNRAYNWSGKYYVAWNWKAGNGTSSNTNGSITSTVSANPDAGFSIVSYTGNGTTGATVGHGLSKAPEMVIIKHLETTGQWQTYHHGINAPDAEDYFVMLNKANAAATDGSASRWNNTDPSATVVTFGNDWEVNHNTKNFIMYCFHSVDGYCKVGSYTGNGSTDGTFVYTGFRPAFVLFKSYNQLEDWIIVDTERDTYNPAGRNWLYADSSSAGSYDGANTKAIDYLSNGFKPKTASSFYNTSGQEYIYLAFAESPFKYSNAR